jgi:hypothetical protein
MTETRGGAGATPDDGRPVNPLDAQWAWLANQPAPPTPAGTVSAVANRMLVHARPTQAPVVLPLLDPRRSGLILAGAKAIKHTQLLKDTAFDGVVLVDPAAHERYAATTDAPFLLPSDQLVRPSLETVLDGQLHAGATAALTPTGYVRAGDTDTLKAAARIVKKLNRTDVIFVAPLDISLVDKKYITQTIAILADSGCPVGLALGKQFDPLTQSKTIIPNLRNLVLQVPTLAMRTDFNAFDLVAHGAFAGGIGTGGTLRHAIEPPYPGFASDPTDNSPSVLFPDLLCWWRGSKIAKLYGARPAPRCHCVVCDGRRLNRFLRRSDQIEAIRHAVAVWTPLAWAMLDATTMRERARYFRALCAGSVDEHTMISARLQLVDPIEPQSPLAQWATLPAWPVGEPATA